MLQEFADCRCVFTEETIVPWLRLLVAWLRL